MEKKDLSKQVQIVKEDLLCLMKRGDVNVEETFTLDEVMDCSKDETSDIFKFVENLFTCRFLSHCQQNPGIS